jgi:hypothetical protein
MADANNRRVTVTVEVQPAPALDGNPFAVEPSTAMIEDGLVELSVVLDSDGTIRSFQEWESFNPNGGDPRPWFGVLFWLINGMPDVRAAAPVPPRKSVRADSAR